MACPIRPPVDDSAVAICQPIWRMAVPRRAAASASSVSDGGVIGQASSVVDELQGHRIVEPPQMADHRLKVILALGRDAYRVSLDRRLHLAEALANDLAQLLCLLGGEATAQPDVLADRAARRRLQLAP